LGSHRELSVHSSAGTLGKPRAHGQRRPIANINDVHHWRCVCCYPARSNERILIPGCAESRGEYVSYSTNTGCTKPRHLAQGARSTGSTQSPRIRKEGNSPSILFAPTRLPQEYALAYPLRTSCGPLVGTLAILLRVNFYQRHADRDWKKQRMAICGDRRRAEAKGERTMLTREKLTDVQRKEAQ